MKETSLSDPTCTPQDSEPDMPVMGRQGYEAHFHGRQYGDRKTIETHDAKGKESEKEHTGV